MYYKIYASVSGAKRASRNEAIKRGCGGSTEYWWGWVVHEDGRAALCAKTKVNDDWVDELDPSWFPDPFDTGA